MLAQYGHSDCTEGNNMADKWHVTSQRQDTIISETGPGFESVWEVGFTIDSGPATGTRGTVRVPVAQYNADTVAAAIDAQVYHLDKVAGL
jgi:hypothetical protein